MGSFNARVHRGQPRLLPVSLALSALAIFGSLRPAVAAFGDRITVSGTEFRAGGARLWINGANTPWHVWNEFGGSYDAAWWDEHLRQLHENGVNATRVWLSCNGETGLEIDSTGHVSGCTEAFWRNLDNLFQTARQRRVYIKATLISFDHFSSSHPHHLQWRSMLTDSGNIDSMVTNYVTPLVMRYRDNPWLWCIDLCNEPDWIYENARCGKISWDWIQTYFARAAVAIHANSDILVTAGVCMGPKYTARPPGTNVVSDEALRAKADGDIRARLDFYSPHYYDWMGRSWNNAFHLTPAAYRLDTNKPVVIGECPARGTARHALAEDYEAAWRNGWQGAMGWTSNGVDGNGGLTELGVATRAFRDQHEQLVFPPGPTAPKAEMQGGR